MSDEPEVVANPPRIWDRELNAAIVTLADRFLPRGYEVRPVGSFGAEDIWQSCEEGRPLVFDRTELPSTSIFGDTEVEHAFQAITQLFMFTPPVAHPQHRPHLCAVMISSGMERLMEEIVKRYGDDARTQRWRKALWTHTMGRLAFNALTGGKEGSDLYDFVVQTLAAVDPDGTEPVNELRDGFIGMYANAEQAREAIIGIMRRKEESVTERAEAQGVTYH